jgi:hypothetical protein
MTGPTELFTLSSFATLQGGALAAIIVPNSIGYFGKLNKAWTAGLALVISELAAYGSAYLSDGDGLKWIIAALNGFVIFSAAMGQRRLRAQGRLGWAGTGWAGDGDCPAT